MSFASAIADLDKQTLKVFGETVTYTPAGGSGVRVKCIWDDYFVEQELVDGAFVQTTSPAAVVSNDDVNASTVGTEGDTIRRGSVTYYISKVMRSDNLVTLKLSKDGTPEAQ